MVIGLILISSMATNEKGIFNIISANPLHKAVHSHSELSA